MIISFYKLEYGSSINFYYYYSVITTSGIFVLLAKVQNAKQKQKKITKTKEVKIQ